MACAFRHRRSSCTLGCVALSTAQTKKKRRRAALQLVAEQETAQRREKRVKIRRAARQFIETMAQAEGEADSEQELESDDESTASDDSFIVGNDVCD